ncbi:hypothetical protein [Lacticaseibacillus hulanensis]|uniref:hypothetical protein n=1 Tax=Lacticaseibacillus hulanensis TaxID=2493111 RepID=UPI000FD80317|nr:hypothetical protein [Lacticaseibacillus hulanensis]
MFDLTSVMIISMFSIGVLPFTYCLGLAAQNSLVRKQIFEASLTNIFVSAVLTQLLCGVIQIVQRSSSLFFTDNIPAIFAIKTATLGQFALFAGIQFGLLVIIGILGQVIVVVAAVRHIAFKGMFMVFMFLLMFSGMGITLLATFKRQIAVPLNSSWLLAGIVLVLAGLLLLLRHYFGKIDMMGLNA